MIEPIKRPPTKASLSSASDRIFEYVILALASVIALVFVMSLYTLGKESMPALREFGASFFTGWTWNPSQKQFGAASMIIGTLVTSLAALAISVPLAIASALFVAEYAPKWLANPVGYLIELLAAVPSIIFGLWGIKVLAPFVAPFTTFLQKILGWFPLFGAGLSSTGTAFVASIVLAIMILPIVTSMSRDVFAQTPRDQRLGERARLRGVPDHQHRDHRAGPHDVSDAVH